MIGEFQNFQQQNILIRKSQHWPMRKILFPIEKLAMVFFYFELLLELDKITYAACSLILMALSLVFEGARPYTPLLLLIIFLEMFGYTFVQIIIVIVAGVAIALLKIYDINVPIKGPYLMGHLYSNTKVGDIELHLSIFYPTLTKTKPIEWIPTQNYNKVLYEIFHVDPKARRIPYKLFKFVVSYIHKIFMPVQSMSPYLNETEIDHTYAQNQHKIIIHSHGLGSHMNASSSIFANWASQGYTIVSIAHDHDEVCVDHRKVSETDHQKIKQYLHQCRNRDLKIRVKEVGALIDVIQKENFMKEYLGVDIKVKEIILTGHSYGGGTALATKAMLNQKYKQNPEKLQLFSKLICLDPWLFPFQDQMYQDLNNQNILCINSQYFYQQVPYIYDLQLLFQKLKKKNPNMKAFVVRGMDHISQCDMAYVFGNILQVTGTIKKHHLTDKFMGLNILLAQLFLQNKTKQEILQIANKFVQQKKMQNDGVEVKEQYRITRNLTFGRKQSNEEHEVTNKL